MKPPGAWFAWAWDPDRRRMAVADPLDFNKAVVDATSGLVCAYKPNIAFYEALGVPGLKALARTVEYIHETAPHVVVIGDAKRGDVQPSGEAYARAMFEVWGFDAVTINAWGGLDSVAPFLEYEERGVFIWCRGSNAGSAEIQGLDRGYSSGTDAPVPTLSAVVSGLEPEGQRGPGGGRHLAEPVGDGAGPRAPGCPC